jgi:hypothetical protein
MSATHVNAHINNYLLGEIQHYIFKYVLRHKKTVLPEVELFRYSDLKTLGDYFIYPRLKGKRVWLLQSHYSLSVYDTNWLRLVGLSIINKMDIIGIFLGNETKTGVFVVTDVFLNNGNSLVSLEYADRLDSLRWVLGQQKLINTEEIDELYQSKKVPSIYQSNILYATTNGVRFRIQSLYYPSSVKYNNFPEGIVFQHRKKPQIQDTPKVIIPHRDVRVYLYARKKRSGRSFVTLRYPLEYFCTTKNEALGYDAVTADGKIVFQYNARREEGSVLCCQWVQGCWKIIGSTEEPVTTKQVLVNTLYYLHCGVSVESVKKYTKSTTRYKKKKN